MAFLGNNLAFLRISLGHTLGNTEYFLAVFEGNYLGINSDTTAEHQYEMNILNKVILCNI